MATRNIIDLSQPITPASPAPCDPPVELRTVARHSPDSPYQMMWFGMTDHTGTHIDAPLHFVPGGKPIDEADLSALYSMPGVFLDFTAVSCFHKIDAGDVERELKQYGSIPRNAFIMLHTGHGLVFQYAGIFQFPVHHPCRCGTHHPAPSGGCGRQRPHRGRPQGGRAPHPPRLPVPWRAYHRRHRAFRASGGEAVPLYGPALEAFRLHGFPGTPRGGSGRARLILIGRPRGCPYAEHRIKKPS